MECVLCLKESELEMDKIMSLKLTHSRELI